VFSSSISRCGTSPALRGASVGALAARDTGGAPKLRACARRAAAARARVSMMRSSSASMSDVCQTSGLLGSSRKMRSSTNAV